MKSAYHSTEKLCKIPLSTPPARASGSNTPEGWVPVSGQSWLAGTKTGGAPALQILPCRTVVLSVPEKPLPVEAVSTLVTADRETVLAQGWHLFCQYL